MKYLYQNIADDLIVLLNSNKSFKASNKLPSIRELAKKYNCSKNTIEKSLAILHDQHYIYSKPQSGYYLVDSLEKNLSSNTLVYNFSTGNSKIDSFPTEDLKHCLNRALDAHGSSSLDIGLNTLDSLKERLPSYLSTFQVYTSPKNIFVNLGILQCLSILSEMPFPNKKCKILIEDPSYSFFIKYLKRNNIPTLTIKRTENGIDLKELKTLFKNEDIKFFYITPRAHNPTGTNLNSAIKKSICELAEKYDVYIVEDDYFGDLDLNSRNLSLFSYSYQTHNIYLKSFSKLLPWIRIGISVIPDNLICSFQDCIGSSSYSYYFSPSLSSEATLDIYLKSALLQKHTASIKNDFKNKLRAFKNCLHELEKLGIHTLGKPNGLYAYIIIPDKIDENFLIKQLEENNVLVSKGDTFYYNKDNYIPGLRLSIGNLNCQEIIDGFNIIIATFNKLSF